MPRKSFTSKMKLGTTNSDELQAGRPHPNLSWTHYRILLRLAYTGARALYEIEALF